MLLKKAGSRSLPGVIFLGGKGGTGKTTLSAALGLMFARRGEQVLVVSTDPAHSLGDLLEVELGDRPREVAPKLWARELDPERARRAYLDQVRANLREFAPIELLGEAERQVELAGRHPGVTESALFESLCRQVNESDRWDRLIFDTAPTGHTLHLLALPEQMQAWTEALLLRQSRRPEGPAPAADARWERARDVLQARRQLFIDTRRRLTDPAAAGFCLVLNPDRLSLAETVRARRDIEAAGVAIPGVFLNRVEEEAGKCEREAEEALSGLEICTLARQYPAPQGLSGLENLSGRLGDMLGP
jgi:arsenite/tail-anchored protein-transporting ATPase